MARRTQQAKADAKLKAQQQKFVEAYLTCWNATEAAKQAGYSAKTAYSQGSRLLRNVEIRRLIDEHLADAAMGAREVLMRLADMAAGSIDDFLNDKGLIDLKKARQRGRMHLVKKYTVESLDKDLVTKRTLELHDAQAALVQLGRYHKLFVDRQEHTGRDGGPIQLDDVKAALFSRFAQSDAARAAHGVPDEPQPG